MALAKCEDCGGPVSENARKCPRCGRPTDRGQQGRAWLAVLVIAVAVFAAFQLLNAMS